ncbi:hypothetical protein [Streptomyces sp. NPDC051776]|uniref:hypothetical protein n=1 Tax=Streptomyces sp. NPDC051776 TaxID=3155414 RepID=UPI003432F770
MSSRRDDAAATVPGVLDGTGGDQEFDALLNASSLGAPITIAVRELTPPEVRRELSTRFPSTREEERPADVDDAVLALIQWTLADAERTTDPVLRSPWDPVHRTERPGEPAPLMPPFTRGPGDQGRAPYAIALHQYVDTATRDACRKATTGLLRELLEHEALNGVREDVAEAIRGLRVTAHTDRASAIVRRTCLTVLSEADRTWRHGTPGDARPLSALACRAVLDGPPPAPKTTTPGTAPGAGPPRITTPATLAPALPPTVAASPAPDPLGRTMPRTYADALGRIRDAVDLGHPQAAVHLARVLEERAADEHGGRHPYLLRAREVRAHVLMATGDPAGAAELYLQVAQEWALRGLDPYWEAAKNAHYCWSLVKDRGRAYWLGEQVMRVWQRAGHQGRPHVRAALRHLDELLTSPVHAAGVEGLLHAG